MLLAVEPEPVEVEEVLSVLFVEERQEQCENCGSTEGVELEDSRTCYTHGTSDDGPNDPNRRVGLCRPCAKEHHEHWDSMWADYYGSRL
jgi:hypothetical protein